jgi:glycosyltransferase 2 family protein
MAGLQKLFRSLNIKRLLNFGGIALGLVGMVFVANRFLTYKNQISFISWNGKTVCILIGLAVLYAAANLLLVFAWQNILRYLGVILQFSRAIQIYGRSQIAKYVPGNIFQFAGRQALGVSSGIANKPLALSVVWELGWIASIGAIFLILALPLIAAEISFVASLLLFITVISITLWIAWRFFSPTMVRVAAFYAFFHIISGGIFSVILLTFIQPAQPFPFNGIASICGAYVVAWLIGLITPGAPGGMGVREMVLYLFFNSLFKPGDLLVVILLSRMVTVCGDGFFFILSFFWRE